MRITLVPFLSARVPKKNTLNRSRIELVMSRVESMDIIGTTKNVREKSV